MSNDLTVRPAADADAAALSVLLHELGYDVGAGEIPRRLAAMRAEGSAAMIATDAPTGAALGLICVASFTALHTAGRVGYITALVTSAGARRRGVGRLLVEHAKAWATARGCIRLSVTSAEHRADAHAFYPACGLPYTGRRFAAALPVAG
jgi:GNAT superfamily N-acetyltransferase